MRKRLILITLTCFVLCLTNKAFAWSVTNLHTWFTKKGNTGFEVTIQDHNWEVTNRNALLAFYDNKRKQVNLVSAPLRDGYLYNGTSYTAANCHVAVTFSGGRFKIKGFLKGKYNIATVRVTIR